MRGSEAAAEAPAAAEAEAEPEPWVLHEHAWRGMTTYNANAGIIGAGYASSGGEVIPIAADTELVVTVTPTGQGVAVGAWRAVVTLGDETLWEADGPEAKGIVPVGDVTVLILATRSNGAQVAWEYDATVTWMGPA